MNCLIKRLATKVFPRPVIKPLGRADKSYNPTEYIRFSDTQDFIREVASLIKIRSVNETKQIRLMMERNKLANHPPLLLLNGYVTTDWDELSRIPLDQIERIDLYRSEKRISPQFGILGRNGVIVFYTKDKIRRSSSGNQISLSGFSSFKPSFQGAIKGDSPSFSPRLYWNGNLLLENDASNSFSVPISNDVGDYYLIVEQITNSSSKVSIQKNST